MFRIRDRVGRRILVSANRARSASSRWASRAIRCAWSRRISVPGRRQGSPASVWCSLTTRVPRSTRASARHTPHLTRATPVSGRARSGFSPRFAAMPPRLPAPGGRKPASRQARRPPPNLVPRPRTYAACEQHRFGHGLPSGCVGNVTVWASLSAIDGFPTDLLHPSLKREVGVTIVVARLVTLKALGRAPLALTDLQAPV